jgi:hypothetical protein
MEQSPSSEDNSLRFQEIPCPSYERRTQMFITISKTVRKINSVWKKYGGRVSPSVTFLSGPLSYCLSYTIKSIHVATFVLDFYENFQNSAFRIL